MVVARVVANRMLIGGYGDGVGDASVTSSLAVVSGGASDRRELTDYLLTTFVNLTFSKVQVPSARQFDFTRFFQPRTVCLVQ